MGHAKVFPRSFPRFFANFLRAQDEGGESCATRGTKREVISQR